MSIALLFGMVVLFMLIGVPIAIALGLSSILFLFIFFPRCLADFGGADPVRCVRGALHAAGDPVFILASVFMSTGGVARRIIRFAVALVGSFKGGLAIASVFACMLFAALSGSSPATVVAIGSIVIAGMVQVGYTEGIRCRCDL